MTKWDSATTFFAKKGKKKKKEKADDVGPAATKRGRQLGWIAVERGKEGSICRQGIGKRQKEVVGPSRQRQGRRGKKREKWDMLVHPRRNRDDAGKTRLVLAALGDAWRRRKGRKRQTAYGDPEFRRGPAQRNRVHARGKKGGTNAPANNRPPPQLTARRGKLGYNGNTVKVSSI